MDQAAISTKKAPTALVQAPLASTPKGIGTRRHRSTDRTGRDQAVRHLGCRRSLHDQPLKTAIFCADVEDFPTINTVYSRHMPDSAPANVARHEIS
jgi:hypothetical protein